MKKHTRSRQTRGRAAVRRVATPAAVIALAGAAALVAAPADAAAAPRATLTDGVVAVTGTTARDVVVIDIDANRVAVDFGADGSVDAQFDRSRVERVQVTTAKGDDAVTVNGTGAVPVTVTAGAGNDFVGALGNFGTSGVDDAPTTIVGNGGNDNVLAATPGLATVQTGPGDDVLDGGGAGTGRENVSLGAGDDLFRSSLNTFAGPRSDVVDGGSGTDSIDMRGTFASETLNLSASGGHLIAVHDQRDRVDADNVEDVAYVSLGGSDETGAGDSISVGDLSSTDVVRFTPDFSAQGDGARPDNSADQLTVVGTAGVDRVTVSGSGANITVAGLSPLVTPVFLQPQDVLQIDTLAGNDSVVSTGLQRGLVQLVVT